MKWARWMALFTGISQTVGLAGVVLCMGVGACFAYMGEMSVGAIIAFVQLSNHIVYPFTQFPNQLGQLQLGRIAIERILHLLLAPTEELPEQLIISFDGEAISIENLSFSYEDKAIFENLNAEFHRDEITGVIGSSGSGKSTLLQLILALYLPHEGRIILRGAEDAEGLQLRNHIAYVPQDHILFSGTVAENIRYNNVEASIEDVHIAARQANADEFIRNLLDGYDTLLYENGKNLSIGQAQRIAIARAILKDSPVLVLDEPTASVDAKSEELILNALHAQKQGKIIIMVTHKADSKNICDHIVNLDNWKKFSSEEHFNPVKQNQAQI